MPTAVVTGASQGVGLATTRALLEAGYTVYAQFRSSPADLDHPNLHWWHADFTDTVTVPDEVAPQSITALIHCAGVAQLGSTHDQPRRDWEHHMAINLHAPVELTQHLLPQLIQSSGQVIYINSGAGHHTHPMWGAYSASKHAARAWCEALRQETPAIRVTSIYPGRIATEMQRAIRHQENQDYNPDDYISADTIAGTILNVLNTPADAQIPDLIIRPR